MTQYGTDNGAMRAGTERTVELPTAGGTRALQGDRFLIDFAIPTFFFHLTTAYAILRHQGVPLRKMDILGLG